MSGIRECPHDLVERVESGSGRDEETDFAVLCLVDRRAERSGPLPGDPRYTTSLDAVVSLIEQKLPGWGHCYATGWDAEGNCGGFVSPERTVDLTKATLGVSKSPARALLAATLRALSALENSKAKLADATPNPPASP